MVVTYSLANTSNNSMKTHRLKQRHDKRKKEVCGGYLQPITSNNSLKTHPLKHRHDKRREKRYVVVIYMQPKTSTDNSMKTHRLKHIDMTRGEKRDVVVICSL